MNVFFLLHLLGIFFLLIFRLLIKTNTNRIMWIIFLPHAKQIFAVGLSVTAINLFQFALLDFLLLTFCIRLFVNCNNRKSNWISPFSLFHNLLLLFSLRFASCNFVFLEKKLFVSFSKIVLGISWNSFAYFYCYLSGTFLRHYNERVQYSIESIIFWLHYNDWFLKHSLNTSP